MSAPKVYFNGVDGATGGYLLPPVTLERLAEVAKEKERRDRGLLGQLGRRSEAAKPLGCRARIDTRKVDQTGWGVVFAHADRSWTENMEALGPLLDLRRSQAGVLYRELDYRPGESKSVFLERHGAGPGPADPELVPYYLLLVGSPELIPFDFQFELDVTYGVGRIDFDSPTDYAAYAASIVAAEEGQTRLDPTAVFFGPRQDRATELSATQLVEPLAREFTGANPDWTVEAMVGRAATRDRLGSLLCSRKPPALLFTAGHGLALPCGHKDQRRRQGALVCQDWPGPAQEPDPVNERYSLAGGDVEAGPGPHGLIAFFFACYGAGTPAVDYFGHQLGGPRRSAAEDFVAHLPKRLLGHREGGALAVVAHVDRTWGYSFNWRRSGSQRTVFLSTLNHLVDGQPVGAAFEDFDQRFAELVVDLDGARRRKKIALQELAGLWTATNDARSYVVLGDPAVRLAPVGQVSRHARPVDGASPDERPPAELM